MKKAAKALYNWFGRGIITVWAYPAAFSVAMRDYIPHCKAWNVDRDEEYFEANIDYWTKILYEKAVRAFPKSWIDSMDERLRAREG